MRYSTMTRQRACRMPLGKTSAYWSTRWKNWVTHSKRRKESEDLLVFDNEEIVDQSAVETVKNAQKIGQQQFKQSQKKALWSEQNPFTIHRIRLKLFVGSTTKTASKEKQQLTSMKSDVELFSRIYISCQMRDGNLEYFFQHDHHVWPSALSDGVGLLTWYK